MLPLTAFLTGFGIGLAFGAVYWRLVYDRLLDKAKRHLDAVERTFQ